METEERIQQVLQKHPHILLAVLFGSLARNAAGVDSGLDLAVGADRPLDANEKMQLVMADAALLLLLWPTAKDLRRPGILPG